MPEQNTIRPTPYNSNDPYIYISFAHKDIDEAVPIITRMQSDGYRIWYDEGIVPGSVWVEDIASHVEQCSCFIALISKNYLESKNCLNELYYSSSLSDIGICILLVYLEDAPIPAGMEMRLGRLQAIFKYKYTSIEQVYEKLYETESIRTCCKAKE